MNAGDSNNDIVPIIKEAVMCQKHERELIPKRDLVPFFKSNPIGENEIVWNVNISVWNLLFFHAAGFNSAHEGANGCKSTCKSVSILLHFEYSLRRKKISGEFELVYQQ